MRKQIYCLLSFLWISCLSVSAADRWAINSAGGITWQVDERVPHEDHIEMSGLRVSTVLRYGVDANGAFMLNRSMVWPMLRTIPNNTHASLMRRFAWNVTDMVEVNGQSLLNEKVKEVTLNGTMVVQSEYTLPRKGKLGLTRILFPSVSNPAFCEKYILRNIGESAISVEIPSSRSVVETDAAKGVDGSYKLVSTINGQVARQLQPGEELTFSATFAGYKKDERELSLDIDRELRREKISRRLRQRLNEGMVDEVKQLLAQGIKAEDLIYYGLEYKYLTLYAIGELTYEEMFTQLETAIHQFAKRQMTWFRGMERRGFTIHWVDAMLPTEEKIAFVKQKLKGI